MYDALMKLLRTSIMAVAAVLTVLIFVIPGMVPTGDDAMASEEKRVTYEDAVRRNFPTNKIWIVSSPRRNATEIIVDGEALTEADKYTLTMLAEEVGRQNPTRPLTVSFRKTFHNVWPKRPQ